MSDKFKVINHATFERMQQRNSAGTTSPSIPTIRNSKYKRMTAGLSFNLLQYIKTKDRGGKKGKIKKRTVDTCINIKTKHRGKQRENGRRKKPSRLKKSILQYRQRERGHEKLEEQLEESIIHLSNLTILEPNPTGNNIVGIHSRKFRK